MNLMTDKMRRVGFLGREFLTWLMVRSALRDNVFDLGRGRKVEVFFEKALTLEGVDPAREASTIRVEDPTNSEEVRIALALGKLVSRARLKVVIEGLEYELTLDCTLGLKTVRLPEAATALDAVEAVAERSDAANKLEETLYSLFLQFVKVRLDTPKWQQELDEITAWVANKQ